MRLKGASQDLDTEGVELTQGTCYGTGSSSDVTAFEFRVTDAADQARRARQKFDADAVASLKKRGQDVVRAIRAVDVNLAIIDSQDISGWEPTSNRWSHFRQNIRAFTAAAGVQGRPGKPAGYHFSAANAEQVSQRFVRPPKSCSSCHNRA